MPRKKEYIDPEIGKRIRKIRTDVAKMTQAQFAELFNVREQTIRNWESGRRKVELNNIQAICSTFNQDVGYVIGLENMIEKQILNECNSLESQNSAFIDYLSSIGIDVNIFPASANPNIDFEKNKVQPSIAYRYELSCNSQPIHAYNESDWKNLQEKISDMIKILIQ